MVFFSSVSRRIFRLQFCPFLLLPTQKKNVMALRSANPIGSDASPSSSCSSYSSSSSCSSSIRTWPVPQWGKYPGFAKVLQILPKFSAKIREFLGNWLSPDMVPCPSHPWPNWVITLTVARFSRKPYSHPPLYWPQEKREEIVPLFFSGRERERLPLFWVT